MDLVLRCCPAKIYINVFICGFNENYMVQTLQSRKMKNTICFLMYINTEEFIIKQQKGTNDIKKDDVIVPKPWQLITQYIPRITLKM